VSELAAVEVIVAAHAGFCSGVQRVVELAGMALSDGRAARRTLYALGWPVHNERVVDELVKNGLRLISSLSQIESVAGSALLLRAHGEHCQQVEQAQKMGLELIDATCPLVERVRAKADSADQSGRALVCIGDRLHPEVAGILSCAQHAPSQAFWLDTNLPIWPSDTPLTVVPQTTIPRELFESLSNKLKQHFADCQVHDLRCRAVDLRQKEALQLANRVDLMVVVGSTLSANTRHLYDLCAANVKTIMVGNADEIDDLPLAYGLIGVTAGASTPLETVHEVARRLSQV